jgi:hypothetical protein
MPYGHVATVLGAARVCGAVQSPALEARHPSHVARKTATHSLSRLLKLGDVELERAYAALDWLGEAQEDIEKRLAWKHTAGSMQVLYDLTPMCVIGHCCEFAARDYSRDGKRDDPQIMFCLYA